MTQNPASNGTNAAVPPPTPQPRAVVCPYCGHVSGDTARCARCSGRFDPLSRQATQNAMGPWSFIDPMVPTRAGCSYETLRRLVERGIVRRDTVVRGPSTRQFWMLATRVPGVAHLLGVCHNCQAGTTTDDYACGTCGAVFEVDKDRQHLGVGPIRLIAGQAPAEQVVASMGGVLLEQEPSPVAPTTPAPVVAPQPTPAAPAGAKMSSPNRDSAARKRLAQHHAARARQRAMYVVLTAVLVLAGGAAMFVMGRLAGSNEPPTESSPAESP